MKPGVEPTDMDSDQLITMVTKAVSAITTRLHSEYQCTSKKGGGGRNKAVNLGRYIEKCFFQLPG